MGILIYKDTVAGNKLLGQINYDRESFATFAYDKDYLMAALADGELGISVNLPLDSKEYNSTELAPFFRGLLPEGEVLVELANIYQVPRNDFLTLIEKIGSESIGALTFASDAAAPNVKTAGYKPLSKQDLSSLATHPVHAAAKVASETRLSLSGAQSKVAWLLPEVIRMEEASAKDWLQPFGSAPSTHIIKVSRRGEEDIALNELACSILALACGIDAAKVSLVADLRGAIAVKRYDRLWIGEGDKRRVLRLHQEDFCQALGLPPYLKYQPEDVACSYLDMICDLLDDASSNPFADKLEFAKRLAFNFAIGNSDAHLKNFSLLYSQSWKGRRLAPMYDITCMPLTQYSTKMAFDIGRHRELAQIDENDIGNIAIALDLPFNLFDEKVAEVIAGLETFKAEGLKPDVRAMAQAILKNAQPRLEILKQVSRQV